eukprot:m51a1_g2019 hypothetical protein (975) ;mRNA; f:1282313-1285794
MTRAVGVCVGALVMAAAVSAATTCAWVGPRGGGSWKSIVNWNCQGVTHPPRPTSASLPEGDSVDLRNLTRGAVVTDVNCLSLSRGLQDGCGSLLVPDGVTLSVSSSAYFTSIVSLAAPASATLTVVGTACSASSCAGAWLETGAALEYGSPFPYVLGVAQPPPSSLALALSSASLVCDRAVTQSAPLALSGSRAARVASLARLTLAGDVTVASHVSPADSPLLRTLGALEIAAGARLVLRASFPSARGGARYPLLATASRELTGAFAEASVDLGGQNGSLYYDRYSGVAGLCVPDPSPCAASACGPTFDGCRVQQCPACAASTGVACAWVGPTTGEQLWSVAANWDCGHAPRPVDSVDLSSLTATATLTGVSCGVVGADVSKRTACPVLTLPPTGKLVLVTSSYAVFRTVSWPTATATSAALSLTLASAGARCVAPSGFLFELPVTVPRSAVLSPLQSATLFLGGLTVSLGAALEAEGVVDKDSLCPYTPSSLLSMAQPGVLVAATALNVMGALRMRVSGQAVPVIAVTGAALNLATGVTVEFYTTNPAIVASSPLFLSDVGLSLPPAVSGDGTVALSNLVTAGVGMTNYRWPAGCDQAGWECGSFVLGNETIVCPGVCGTGSNCSAATHSCFVDPTNVQTCTWLNANGGSWTDATRWSCLRVPAAGSGDKGVGDNVNVSNLGDGQVITNVSCYIADTAARCGALTLPTGRWVTLRTARASSVAAFTDITQNALLRVEGGGTLDLSVAESYDGSLTLSASTARFPLLRFGGTLRLLDSYASLETTTGDLTLKSTSTVYMTTSTAGISPQLRAAMTLSLDGSLSFLWGSASDAEPGTLALGSSAVGLVGGSFDTVAGNVAADDLWVRNGVLGMCWPARCDQAGFECGTVDTGCAVLSCRSCPSSLFCVMTRTSSTCAIWPPPNNNSYSELPEEGGPDNTAWKGVLIAVGTTAGGACLLVGGVLFWRSYKKNSEEV